LHRAGRFFAVNLLERQTLPVGSREAVARTSIAGEDDIETS
jgi:hypothetical protein